MANIKSIDLDSSASQYLSLLQAGQTGLDLNVFSMEIWFKAESIAARNGLFGKVSNARRYAMSFTATNIELYVYEQGGGETQVARSFSFSINTWYHVACTYDSSGNCKLYVNGSQIGTLFTGGPTSLRTDASTLEFGRIFNSNNFNGLLDEAIIWNDVRSDAEIAESYNSGNGKIYNGDEAGMVGYWRMEDNLLDTNANGNDLTNNNSATFSSDVPFAGGGSPFTLEVDTMALAFTFNDLALQVARKLAVDTMALDFTFNDVILTGPGAKIEVDTMALDFTFNDVTLTHVQHFTLSVDTMALSFTFNDVEFNQDCCLIVDTMALDFVFNDVTLTHTEALKLQVDTMALDFTFNDVRLKGPIRWTNQTKNTSVFTNQSKNTSIWANQAKSS